MKKTRQEHSITVTNLGDRVHVTGGGIPPLLLARFFLMHLWKYQKALVCHVRTLPNNCVTTPDR